MSTDGTTADGNESALVAFLLENRSWMNAASMVMVAYAVWAVIEVLSNTWFHGLQDLTLFVTGEATNTDPDDLQRNNSGWIMASGAVLGLVGLASQYIYRAAPYIDSSMVATAAMILDQASTDRVSEEEIIAKAEEAATVAATEVAKETAEDTVIEMLDPDAGEEEAAEEEAAEEEAAEEEAAEEEAAEEEAAEEEAAEEEAAEEEAAEEDSEEGEETPPEDMKKF